MKDYINYLLDTVNNILISKFLAMLIFNMKNCTNAQINRSSTWIDHKAKQNVVNRMHKILTIHEPPSIGRNIAF